MAEPPPCLPACLPGCLPACLPARPPASAVFGILFGLVGGIMVYISLKELLPGARRFDPKDKVTTALMAVRACSTGGFVPLL